MQGLGLYTLEELKFSPSGLLYTRGPSQYKIPAVCDVPLRFNVYLLSDTHNPLAIYSSKVRGRDAQMYTSINISLYIILLFVCPFFLQHKQEKFNIISDVWKPWEAVRKKNCFQDEKENRNIKNGSPGFFFFSLGSQGFRSDFTFWCSLFNRLKVYFTSLGSLTVPLTVQL